MVSAGLGFFPRSGLEILAGLVSVSHRLSAKSPRLSGAPVPGKVPGFLFMTG